MRLLNIVPRQSKLIPQGSGIELDQAICITLIEHIILNKTSGKVQSDQLTTRTTQHTRNLSANLKQHAK